MRHGSWALVALLGLGGCAGTPETPTVGVLETADASGERKICTSTHIVGSNRKQRVCKTPKQIEAERQHARDFRDRMNEGRPEVKGPRGGS